MLTLTHFVCATLPIVLTPENFSEVTRSAKPTFVKFFAPWCGHCKKMKPDWEKLASVMDSDKITIADVDCTDSGKDICSSQEIQGFPTLKYFESGIGDVYDESDRSFESLKKFAMGIIGGGCSLQQKESCNQEELDHLEKYSVVEDSDKTSRIEEITKALKELDLSIETLLKNLQQQYQTSATETDEKKKKLNVEKKIIKKLLNNKNIDTKKEEL